MSKIHTAHESLVSDDLYLRRSRCFTDTKCWDIFLPIDHANTYIV